MRARMVVFPIKGRSWCFARSLEPASGPNPSSSSSSSPPPSWRNLWTTISSGDRSAHENAEIVIDFVADKMNRGWAALEKAPPGTVKSKIHSLGSTLLSRVKPSEVFLKSVSKDLTKVEIAYPASLNPRLVRRRLRHIAIRGSAIHRKYFYGSISLLPITAAFSVLPLPNIPFFWVLFRAYSNWRALKGSERLLLLVSDCPGAWSSLVTKEELDDLKHAPKNAALPPWVLQPSDDLDKLLISDYKKDYGLDAEAISNICERYYLNRADVLKYREASQFCGP